MSTTITEISEEITVTGASSPSVATITSAGASIAVSPGTSTTVLATSSDGNQVTIVSSPVAPPATSVATNAQVIVEVSGTLPGPPGHDGADGGAGPTDEITFIRRAAITLSGHRLVIPVNGTTVTYADSATLSHTTRPVWLTVTAALAGDDVSLVAFGDVSEPSWNWTPGLPIFLGQNGMLTQVPPSTANGDAFILQVASPDSATDLFYNPRTAIVLAP